jgi:hypothetical protein
MRERPGSADQFRVGLQVRDANSVALVVRVPVFVQGHRYGSVARVDRVPTWRRSISLISRVLLTSVGTFRIRESKHTLGRRDTGY